MLSGNIILDNLDVFNGSEKGLYKREMDSTAIEGRVVVGTKAGLPSQGKMVGLPWEPDLMTCFGGGAIILILDL